MPRKTKHIHLVMDQDLYERLKVRSEAVDASINRTIRIAIVRLLHEYDENEGIITPSEPLLDVVIIPGDFGSYIDK
jgi:hypothetical protein